MVEKIYKINHIDDKKYDSNKIKKDKKSNNNEFENLLDKEYDKLDKTKKNN